VAQFLTDLTHWPPPLIYLVAAVLVSAETATVLGLAAPGEITLLIVGFLCYRGTLYLVVALPVMVAAALAGDSLGYLAGRRLGPRLRSTRLGRRVGDQRWARADALLLRHGGRAVFLARFIAFARTLTPRLAGMSGLRYRVFLPWNAAGVLGCAGGTLLVGYAAGRSYATVTQVFGQASSAVLALLLLIVAIVIIGQYLGRYPDPLAATGRRLAGWPPLRFVQTAYRAGFGWLTQRVGVGGAVAVNVLGGAVVLLGVGYGLTWSVDRLVRHSGLLLVDPLLTRWAEAHRTPLAVQVATDALLTLRGSFLILLVGVLAILLNWRSSVWRADLAGVLGTGGAFVPLVIITLVTDWQRSPDAAPHPGFFPNQTAVVATSLGMLAWLLSRRFGWRLAVAAWTGAVGLAAVVGAGRVYVGWSWPSEVVASTLLGGLWVLVFMVAWHTRDRARARAGQRAEPAPMALTR
jgi:membrane protein DedA with SNARE-associated domain/membrane-associated phospholipid phosphatase